MKAALIMGLVALGIFGVVKVLGSTLAPPEYGNSKLRVTGSLELGAVSRADMDTQIWREARGTHSRRDREELLVGTLEKGTVFEVLLHHLNGDDFWVKIRSRSDPTLEGWLISPAEAPMHATKLP